MINKTMQDAINAQINKEMYSSYLYLAMAAHFEAATLPGFAHWMRIQATEETAHAMKFFDHLLERDREPVLPAIPAPPKGWKSVEALCARKSSSARACCTCCVASRNRLEW